LPYLRAVIAERDFRRLYVVRVVGQFGDGMLQSALATFVLFSPERQPTAASVAAAFAILLLPYSLVGPFAGVFLDRWSRRQVLVYANLLRAVVVIGVALLVAARNDGAALGITVLVCLGIGRFVLAGLSASLPHVVSGRALVTANALFPTSGTIASAVGALVGVGVRALGCYVLAAAAATRMARTLLGPFGDRPGESFRGVVRGLIDGGRALREHAAARRAIEVVMMHRIAFGALTVIALLLVRNTFNPSTDPDAALLGFAFVTAAAAAGGLVGAIVTPGASRRVGVVAWTTIVLAQAVPLIIAGVLVGAYAVQLVPLLVAALSLGFAGQSVKVMSDTVVQSTIPDDRLGRVFALFDMAVNVCLVLGITAIAFTAPASGIAPIATVLVGVLLAATAAWYARHR
jgi:MFS family permease